MFLRLTPKARQGLAELPASHRESVRTHLALWGIDPTKYMTARKRLRGNLEGNWVVRVRYRVRIIFRMDGNISVVTDIELRRDAYRRG